MRRNPPNDNGFSTWRRSRLFVIAASFVTIYCRYLFDCIAALAKRTCPILIEKDVLGWRYRADLGVERIDYRADAADDKLPTKMDEPSVYDWDGDGHPGATLRLSVPLLPDGELYVVQRGHSILSDRILQPGKIEGGIEVRGFKQRVLGALPSFLDRSPGDRTESEGRPLLHCTHRSGHYLRIIAQRRRIAEKGSRENWRRIIVVLWLVGILQVQNRFVRRFME